MKNIIKNSVKITVAGAAIVTIGFAFLVGSPTPEPMAIEEANADVGTYFLKNPANEFTYAMVDAGIHPRPFNLNGNTMFFGHTYSDETPHELMDSFGDFLIDKGINKKKHDGSRSQIMINRVHDVVNHAEIQKIALDRGVDVLKGEVVPIAVTRDKVTLTGIMLNEDPDALVHDINTTELPNSKTPFLDRMNGYRFIEFQRENNRTLITAVWTDDQFSGHKLENKHFKKEPADSIVPSCIGCERDISFEPLAGDEPYKLNKFSGSAYPDQMRKFYVDAMTRRGWKVSRSQQVLDHAAPHFPDLRRIKGKMLSMERNGQHIDMSFVPTSDGKTDVYSMQRKVGGSMVQIPLQEAIEMNR